MDSQSLSSSAVSEATGEHNDTFTRYAKVVHVHVLLYYFNSKREVHLVIESRIAQFLSKLNKLLLHNLLLVR